MSTLARETGTYRTNTGSLVHFRPAPDGTIVLDAESSAKLGLVDDLVKLSDDPDWPDVVRRTSDIQLFAD